MLSCVLLQNIRTFDFEDLGLCCEKDRSSLFVTENFERRQLNESCKRFEYVVSPHVLKWMVDNVMVIFLFFSLLKITWAQLSTIPPCYDKEQAGFVGVFGPCTSYQQDS